MTLQALRNEVGDDDFFEIIREWAASKSSGNGTTPEFIALAEQISGQQLDDVFDLWLFTGEKPPPDAVSATAQTLRSASGPGADGWRDEAQRRLRDGRY